MQVENSNDMQNAESLEMKRTTVKKSTLCSRGGDGVYLTNVDVTPVLAGTCPTDSGASLGGRPRPAIWQWSEYKRGAAVQRRRRRRRSRRIVQEAGD